MQKSIDDGLILRGQNASMKHGHLVGIRGPPFQRIAEHRNIARPNRGRGKQNATQKRAQKSLKRTHLVENQGERRGDAVTR